MQRTRIVLVTLGACALGLGLWLTSSAQRVVPQKTLPNRAREDRGSAAPTRTAARAASAPTIPATGAPAAAANEPGEVVVKAVWGAAKGQLGRRVANESAPEGPMSFAVDAKRRTFVVDQVNSRVSVFEDGSEPRTIPLPSESIQDIALRGDAGFVALDRFGSADVAFLDRTGTVTQRIALAGEGVESAGDVTALYQRADGTWVEVKHERLVQIADASGAAVAPRAIAPGRFGENGAFLRVSKSGSNAASLAVIEPGQTARALARVEFPMRVWQILGLEAAPGDRIVVAADLYEESPAPVFARTAAAENVVVLSRAGAELRRFELAANDGAEESFRRIRIGADGALYHMGFSEAGVTIRRISL